VSTEIPLDNDTRAALLLFNERLEEAAAQRRADKRVAKAERDKETAAALVRKLGDNPQATAEEKAEAEAAYKASVENYNLIKADPTAGLDSPKPLSAPKDSEAEAPLAEVSADEETSQTAPASGDESD